MFVFTCCPRSVISLLSARSFVWSSADSSSPLRRKSRIVSLSSRARSPSSFSPLAAYAFSTEASFASRYRPVFTCSTFGSHSLAASRTALSGCATPMRYGNWLALSISATASSKRPIVFAYVS